jgi:hypothetical protein
MADHAPATGAPVGAGAGEVVRVRFAGGGVATGQLSWGQLELWQAMRRKHTWLPIGAALPLPTGTTVADAVADLRFVMSRYPSMRTRLRLDLDGPRQVVAGSGETRLEIVDAPRDADPAQVAEQVRARYFGLAHDFVTDWPLRMAVVRHHGQLTHRVWVFCHLATDGTGARVILEDLADRGPPGRRAGPAGPAPLEQVRWQRSPAGHRQTGKSLRYWEKVLRGVPARRFPDRAGTPHPRYWRGVLDSPATDLAIRAVSARTGIEQTSVLLAMFVVAVARVTGSNPVVVQLTVSNRFRPGLARTVSPVIQMGLCVVDVTDATVDEMVVRTRFRAMTAYKHAYQDPVRLDELLARVNRERGEEVDIGCYFNDSRLRPRDRAGPPPTPAQVRAALPRTTFRWLQQQDHRPYDPLFVTVEDVPDTAEIEVATDLHRLPPADAQACVRGIEEVAVAAALDPAARTRVPAPGGVR